MDNKNDGGWFSVKKRGRDDERIAADRARALEERRFRQGLPPLAKKTKTAASAAAAAAGVSQKKNKMKSTTKVEAPVARRTSKKRPTSRTTSSRSTHEQSLDRLDSMVDFVVHSSEDDDDDGAEDDEKEWKSDDDEEDDETDMDLPNDDDESADESPSLFPKYERRHPTQHPKKQRVRLQKATKATVQQHPPQTSAVAKKPVTEDSWSSSSSSDDEVKNVASKTIRTKKVVDLQDSSSEDDTPARSKYFAKNNNQSKTTKLKDTPTSPSTERSKPKTSSSVLDCLEDTPMEEAAIRKRPQPAAKRRPKDLQRNKLSDDYCDDMDEAMAIILAQEESSARTNASTKQQQQQQPTLPNDNDDDESRSEGEPEDNDDDGYMDENAQAASSILETADELSAQILQTMAGWSASAADGMIVDGALSLSTLSSTTTTTTASQHTWISAETMREILPQVQLAEYQLIGVNWLALLHGMKCVLKGGNNKKRQYTNVNGILADEMGLVRLIDISNYVQCLCLFAVLF